MTSCDLIYFEGKTHVGFKQVHADIVLPLYSFMAAILQILTHHWEFKTFNMHLLHNVSM